MRLLFVTAQYSPAVGGTEVHTHEVARRLLNAGHDVDVVTVDTTARRSYFDEISGVPVIRVPAWPRGKDWYFAPPIRRVVTLSRVDIVHCQGYHTLVAPLAMYAALRSPKPYVLSFHTGGHSSLVRTRMRPLQLRALRPLLVRAARLVAVSQFEADFVQQKLGLPASDFRIIPNGANLTDDSNTDEVDVDPNLIITAGRLERYKGHHKVLKALPRIVEERPDARLVILGTGPYEGQLRRLARQLGCADRVEFRFFPATEREDIAQLLKSAGVITFLSAYEAQGIGALEAIYLRRPALVANVSAFRELVDRGLATGVEADATTEEIALAILAQLRNPLVGNGVRLPTWEECTETLLDMYRAVLDERAPKRPRRFA